jgi:hypothetical protein
VDADHKLEDYFAEMATLGLSKVFILDKYFTELQKYWETERKLQGKCFRLDEFSQKPSNRQNTSAYHLEGIDDRSAQNRSNGKVSSPNMMIIIG